jgi:ferric-dicitrate binding protein FerR (iron transport regulator)
MNEQEFKRLIDKYLAGTCTPEEKQLLETIDAGFDEVPVIPLSATAQEETGRRVFRAIETKKNRTIPLWLGRISAAAVIAGLLLAGGWLWKQQNAVQPDSYAEVSTASGQQKTVQLPDGSVVVLNAGSRLVFPRSFTDSTRTVSLEGEAFFTVHQQRGQPFLVHTGKLTTRVLGTSFNIHAYAGRPAVTISLSTGKVQVTDSAAVLGLLLPGTTLEYNNQSGAVAMQQMAVPDIALWQAGTLVFKQATLEEVAFTLQNRYGVSIGFEDAAVANARITTRFQRNTTLKEILNILASLNKVQYTWQNNHILIRKP